jgi:GT2 family glycosyltransferase
MQPPQPTVSIVVLNYDGRLHLGPCFESLRRLNYPSDRLELILVDNASTDDSLSWMQSHYPAVELLALGSNRGFAAANNLAARSAGGDYVLFLNNDTRVREDCLTRLVEAVDVRATDGDVVCAGARMLNWNGTRIDFDGGGLHFNGFGIPLGRGQPVAGQSEAPRPTLFACGGAMLIQRSVFVDAGGFDEDYFIYYEDVDLGWRLWILGYQVVHVPAAVVYHREHGHTRAWRSSRVRSLLERNAFCTVFKNYEAAHADACVDTAARLVELRLRLDSAPHRHTDALDPNLLDDDSRQVYEFVAGARRDAHLQRKRATVQRRRVRPDSEIVPLFRHPLLPERADGRYARRFRQYVLEAGLDSLFGPPAEIGPRALEPLRLASKSLAALRRGGPRWWLEEVRGHLGWRRAMRARAPGDLSLEQ